MELFDTTYLQSQLFWTGVSFLILLLIMWKYVVPAVAGVLDERANQIREDLERAEKAREAADKTLVDYQKQLDAAKNEAGEIIATARAEAQKIMEARTAELEAELTRKAEAAETKIAVAREKAVSELKAEAATLVVSAAEALLKESVDSKKAAKITDDALKALN